MVNGLPVSLDFTGLDAWGRCVCIPPAMKKLFALVVLGVVLSATSGCYRTQEGRSKMGVPFSKDTIENRYERPASQLFAAAKEVLAFNGTLTGENTITMTLAAKVDERGVWVKVEEIEPSISRVLVQARRPGGRGDIDLASEIATQIALQIK